MTVADLIVVREPSRVVPRSGAGPSEDGTAALAAALAGLSGRAVALFEGFVRDAPSSGLLIIRPTADFGRIASELDPEAAAALPARSVLMDGRREQLVETLELFGLAGGIDDHRFFQWHTGGDHDHDRGSGLFGLRSVAARLEGASMLSGPRLDTKRYGYILGDRSRGLPGELLDYLNVYEQVQSADHVREAGAGPDASVGR
jgi:hypothetical protein